MKQILRYFFVTIFAMVGLNVNANVTDELTWDKLLARQYLQMQFMQEMHLQEQISTSSYVQIIIILEL